MALPMRAIVFAILLVLLGETWGHGMLIDPPNRSSIWRFYPGFPENYDDNQNYCGGLTYQTNHGGECGVCGDPYDAPHPQDNENTGKYGQGQIAATYTSGSLITVTAKLTTNHKGTFVYSLCVLPDSNAPEPGEDCFQTLTLGDGTTEYHVDASEHEVLNQIQLPSGLKCDRCVLRWHYTAGNNWGQCEDGTSAEGCGPQETFRSCTDITIN